MSGHDLFQWGSGLSLIIAYVWLAVAAVRANGSLATIPATRRLIHGASMGWVVFLVLGLVHPDWVSIDTKVAITRALQALLIAAMLGLIALNRSLRRALCDARERVVKE